ncbi:hypothetical protein SAMN04487996_12851 [Dyadobacter soli]|uniref:Uncharacterized protein n=1 Tax=Dyadobacter soli TaxID=659014 RepID=A0A1G7ZK19_9BACT|nr:hypothetical protein [Dyadobacter soli]SDH08906.1 hypothetical protein SAMN04487996_12851 [Dyadobacter soli]
MEPKRKSLFDNISEIPVDDSIPDVSNHPFFEKKRLDAIEFIKNHPIPKRDLRSDNKPQH